MPARPKLWRLNEAWIWTPVCRSHYPANLASQTAKLVEPRQLHFVLSANARFHQTLVLSLTVGGSIFVSPGHIVLSLFILFFGLLAWVICFYAPNRNTVFDLDEGTFVHKSEWQPSDRCLLADVVAVQLIGAHAYVDAWEKVDESRESLELKGVEFGFPRDLGHEVVLLLIDGSRQLVACHNDGKAAKESAEVLAEFLDVPLWSRFIEDDRGTISCLRS